MLDLSIYPGGDLVARGLDDLERGRLTEDALLATVAAPRLRALGFAVAPMADPPRFPEHALFERIEDRLERGAHAAYNALLTRMTSFVETYGVLNRRP